MLMTVERGGSASGGARSRRGSALSDRQIAYAVRDGKQVTATLATGDKITGYVFGSDDFHWALVDEHAEVHLVHKSNPSLTIHRKPSIGRAAEAVKVMVAPFREAVMRDHFQQDPSRQTPKD